MGTVDLLSLISEAKTLGLSLALDGNKLNITGPKTPAAGALVAQMATIKADIVAYLNAPDLPPTITKDKVTAEIVQPAPPDDLACTLADVEALAIDPSPLPPLRNRTQRAPGKPSLPVELWAKGLATFAEARQAQQRLSVDYGTALGKDGAGYFVRCPGWQW